MTISAEHKTATGQGLATIARDGRVLDVWYPSPHLDEARDPSGTERITEDQAALRWAGKHAGATGVDQKRSVEIIPVSTTSDLGAAPKDALDVYLRLHMLSYRLIRPHGANLSNMFELLTNVAWTSEGPCLPENIDELRWRLRREGARLDVRSVDKIPQMTDYVVPSGVRIANADRVRLGAHLAIGTTVMHEGFCNFNAGTLGPSMVEGRISAGVVVGTGTDIGGGASIMGTLSGGGKEVITIGRECLLGANSGIGISLGDACVVEAGCYITAGTRVKTPEGVFKAAELSGRSNLLFRRNSQTGTVEVLARANSPTLNSQLHAN